VTDVQKDATKFTAEIGVVTPHPDQDGLTILSIVNGILRNVRILVIVPLMTALLAGALSIRTRQYESESKLMPEVRGGQMPGFLGIAAQFGIDLGGGRGSESVEFYVQLLQTEELLVEAARTEYAFATSENVGDSVQGNLYELFGIRDEDERARRRRVVTALRSRISVLPSLSSGIITLRVRSPWPGLSESINARLLELVDSVNQVSRRSQASAERTFVEARLRDTGRQLEESEAELAEFLEEKRRYEDSPQLLYEYGRIQRRVDLDQQVFTTLSQALEQARIEEVRNTPVVTVLDSPQDSARPTGGLLLTLVVGVGLGLGFATFVVLVREYLRLVKESEPEDYREFVHLRKLMPRRVIPRWLLRSR